MQSTTPKANAFTEYTPVEYLMIDIATNYGDTPMADGTTADLDKLDFEDRIDWFKMHEKAGTLASLIDSADNPALFFAGLLAYKDMLDDKPIGYPISLDACSSGMQILAAFSNCEKSARRCGVVSTGHREDAYTSLFEDMQRRHSSPLKATRKSLKQAVMTSLYGSTAMPKKLFGDGTPELMLYYNVIENEIPGAWELNVSLKSLWQPYENKHSWTLPDGFDVQMDVTDVIATDAIFNGKSVTVYTKDHVGTPTGRSLGPNIVHSVDGMIVREMYRRCSFDTAQVVKANRLCMVALNRKTRNQNTLGRGRPKDEILAKLWKMYLRTNFLSARVIDLIDENNIGMISATALQNLLMTLPAKRFELLAIHDCFRVHPNYGNDLRRQYNQILSELAASDIISNIATQITGRKMTLRKVGDISAKILDANYTLS